MDGSFERKRSDMRRANLLGTPKATKRSKIQGLHSPQSGPTRRMVAKGLGVGAAFVTGLSIRAAGTAFGRSEADAETAPAVEGAFAERVLRRQHAFLTYKPNYVYLLNKEGEHSGDPIPVNDIPNTLSPDIPEIGTANAAEVNEQWLTHEYNRAHIALPEEGPRCDVAALSYMDIIRHYGGNPAKGEALKIGHVSLLEYLRRNVGTAVKDIDNAWIREKLITTVPALIGIESNFDNRAHSATGAKGAVQHTEHTWKTIGRTILHRTLDEHSFADQVDFLGAHLADTVNSFTHAHRAVPVLSWIREHVYQNDEERFTRDFIFPSVITAYNTGTGVMLDVIEWFQKECEKLKEHKPSAVGSSFDELKALRENDMPELFYHMAMKANGKIDRFGDEATGYYAKIYALEPLIEDIAGR